MQNIFIFISRSLFIAMVCCYSAFGQKPSRNQDSIDVYKNIETYSSKRKVTKFLYSLIFKPVSVIGHKRETKNKLKYRVKQNNYRAFEGKIIRHIKIETLDPFGYSVKDTTVAKQNILTKTGNVAHRKSRHITIRNLLLFRPNQKFDSLLVKESERLIRSQKFVHDVSFYVVISAKLSDSVDLFIRELDNWSMIPEVSGSSSRIKIGLTDKNILGFGHEFQNAVTWNHSNGRNAYHADYLIPNIRNTFISSKLYYEIDENRNFKKGLELERPFFSPLARWAVGVLVSNQFKKDSILNAQFLYQPVRIKFNIQDCWAAVAKQILKGNSEDERTTNLIFSARFFRIHFLQKPEKKLDTLNIYSNENFYMATLGVTTRKYVQDKYIFNYGVLEDVPIGRVYGITGGYQKRNQIGRMYIGTRYSIGNYRKWGYLSYDLECGTYLRNAKIEQGVFLVGLSYFTDLFEIGNWKFRQFIKPEVTIGVNRFSYDSLTLNDGYGLDGFASHSLSGNSRLLLTMQTQSYAPWSLFGFRFGPYLSYSMGLLGDIDSGFKRSRVYSQFGFGVLIRNEKLVFNTFQFSITFFPIVPGQGQNIFKTNSFKTTDFGFKDFEIGKPMTADYR